MRPDLSVNIAGIRLKNPVLAASGTFGYGTEYADIVDINKLGGLVTKAITLKPREGTPPPRTVETAAGMLNSIGLANVGVDAFIKEKIPLLHKFNTAVIVNVAGSTVAEYVEVVRRLDGCKGIDGLEINISCPNVKQGGFLFGSAPQTAAKVIGETRKVTSLPLIAKLTPNVTDIVSIARAVEDAGADALSLINTLLGMAIDVETKRSKLANVTGGLSGPAIKPVALVMVWKVAGAAKVPVVGIGGILSVEDALEFLLAGACAVQVGTGNFVDPQCTITIIHGLEQYCREKGIVRISEIVGTLEVGK